MHEGLERRTAALPAEEPREEWSFGRNAADHTEEEQRELKWRQSTTED